MPKVLIVDDDDEMRHIIKLLLEKVKIDADNARNGLEGIQFIKRNNYDIVCLDIKMPKLNGEQFMGIFKKRDEKCPVIVISGYLEKEQIIRFVKLGVKGFLSKPIDVQKFYQEINKICPIEIPKV